MNVDRYLQRIGFNGPVVLDIDTLERLMRAHLTTVPFENLDVFNAIPVGTETELSVAKVLDQNRGGWCFELNGAFALLLEQLGFDVARIGAAVLLSGSATVVDHLTLEVMLDEPYLVDVGFGDSFCRPLKLNRAGPQDGGSGLFELLPSPQGTTLARNVDGAPEAQYRFKRVTLQMPDFDAVSRLLQTDLDLQWHQRAFVTRYLDGGPDRVTLIGNQLKLQRGSEITNTTVADRDWSDTLKRWFGFRIELSSPADRTGS